MSERTSEMALPSAMSETTSSLQEWLGFSRSANLWTRLRHFIGSPAGAVLGGILFAIWAAFINRDGGTLVSLRSSAGQFLLSTTLTLIDARLMLSLFRSCRHPALGAFLSASGSLLFTYILVIGVHLLIGTPHIFLTVLPGIPPTLGYTFMYTLLLLREHAPNAAAD
jgi:hypothetical protein